MVQAESETAACMALRDELLGPLRKQTLSTEKLCEVGRLFCGAPERMSLYGVAAPHMEAGGVRVRGRTAVECTIDEYAGEAADAVALYAGNLREGSESDPLVVDLFCGSGNLGHHLGRRLGHRVHASELDPQVYETARDNLSRVGSGVEVEHTDYRHLIARLGARTENDVYVVEPPWGDAVGAVGLDLTRTTPPVADILADILRARAGKSCVVVTKTTTETVCDSLRNAFRGAAHLCSFAPSAPGAGVEFHIFRLGATDQP
ncbi:RsmD family RNA methyltransferase [Streptomyces sp. NPDC053499]|uniref:RsmD family RNA methyltransferase n=1 Tax=Streptomyces sp. NPDC053499 TaxID=3365707 RepID=UPI0037D36A75